MLPYGYMQKEKYKTPDEIEYYLDRQTAGLSFDIAMIDRLLKEEN